MKYPELSKKRDQRVVGMETDVKRDGWMKAEENLEKTTLDCSNSEWGGVEIVKAAKTLKK